MLYVKYGKATNVKEYNKTYKRGAYNGVMYFGVSHGVQPSGSSGEGRLIVFGLADTPGHLDEEIVDNAPSSSRRWHFSKPYVPTG